MNYPCHIIVAPFVLLLSRFFTTTNYIAYDFPIVVHDLHKDERSVLSMLCLTKNQFSCLHLYFQTRKSFPHFISASCLWHITKKLSIIVCIIFHFLILSYSHVHLISVLLHLLSCAQLHAKGEPHENSVFATLTCFFQSLYIHPL